MMLDFKYRIKNKLLLNISLLSLKLEESHGVIAGEEKINYIHTDNPELMCNKDKNGSERLWIYETHFVDSKFENWWLF